MKAQLRRVWRLLRLILHFALGMAAAHGLFRLLKLTAGENYYDYQQAITRWWNATLCRILKLHIRIDGRVNSRPTLFVANHISWLDIICLAGLLNANFVAKEEVRGWPLFGAMAARAGGYFLRRGERDSTAMVADQMTWHLARRRNLVMFPEGTTSNGESVAHFHARLFQSALRARADVQAIGIAYPHPAGFKNGVNPVAPFVGDNNLLDNLFRLLLQPSIDVQLTFCAPLFAEGTDRRTLAGHARAQIMCALKDTHYGEELSA